MFFADLVPLAGAPLMAGPSWCRVIIWKEAGQGSFNWYQVRFSRPAWLLKWDCRLDGGAGTLPFEQPKPWPLFATVNIYRSARAKQC